MIRQKGFTLLEVLVAVLVLAIGLLGLAGLQATSLQVNQSASMRSQATNLAYDMADRIRANRSAARAGDYDSQALATTPPSCAVITLSGTLAARDIAFWRNALACTLPLSTGSIARTGDTFTITIQWDDTHGQAATPQQFVMMTDL
ncbi:MAG: type IV pilus modification protein PilV [Candidatus Contendobacter sp.]|jgi:type IV pilus assembly protein PilV|nr:type IV pilus modification protein PilV [Candidatus Contendobacter sp.]